MGSMLDDNLQRVYGESALQVMEATSGVYRVYVNGRWITSEIGQETAELSQRYDITWEV